MQKITRIMTPADEAMEQAELSQETIEATHKELLRFEKTYPQYTHIKPLYLLLALLPLLAFFTDPYVEKPAIQNLWESYAMTGSAQSDAVKPTVPTYWVLFIVAGQALVVFSLSYFGKSTPGFSGVMLRGAGLLAAVAIPAMAVSSTLAQASVTSLLNGSTPTWLQTAQENMHVIAFALFSVGVHCLIWAKAADIATASEALIVIAQKRRLTAKERRKERERDGWKNRSEEIVISVLSDNTALAERFPDDAFEVRYITSNPKVADMIERHKHDDDQRSAA